MMIFLLSSQNNTLIIYEDVGFLAFFGIIISAGYVELLQPIVLNSQNASVD